MPPVDTARPSRTARPFPVCVTGRGFVVPYLQMLAATALALLRGRGEDLRG